MAHHIQQFSGEKIHMIGIGGSSMSGLAELLQKSGYRITGSDNYPSATIETLCAKGIEVIIGHKEQNVQGASLVIYSAAILADNPERMEAERLNILQMERSTLLGQLMEGFTHSLCIAGTHGKTTTTAMVTQILMQADMDPTVHIGGKFELIDGSTRIGSRDIFVAEACEFNASFLEMHPTIAVILNIEEDHLDFYRDIDHITETFGRFASLVPAEGFLVVNGDDARALQLLHEAKCHTLSYGLEEHNRLRPQNLSYDERGRASFEACLDGNKIADISLSVGGEYNMHNALAALACAHILKTDMKAAEQAMRNFKNVHRRFEHTGTVQGVELYHDYGHNPVEMRGALSVAAKLPHHRLWAVMQPHTYSRVKRLFDEYISCCIEADEILVTDIYAAREKDPGDIHSSMLVEAIAKTGQNVHFTPSFEDAERYLRAHWQPGDVVLTMGCGNINELNEMIEKHGE